jgi:hypothetical protein
MHPLDGGTVHGADSGDLVGGHIPLFHLPIKGLVPLTHFEKKDLTIVSYQDTKFPNGIS